MAIESKVAVQDLSNDLEKLKVDASKNRRFNKDMADDGLKKVHEQKLKELKLVKEKVTGTVKWYSVLGHYGFIAPDDGEDVFVHQSSILESRTKRLSLRTLDKGEKVRFDIVEGPKGCEAVNVTGPEGAPVIGSRFQLLQIPYMREAFFEHRDWLKDKKDGGSIRHKSNNVRNKRISEAGDDGKNEKPRRKNNRNSGRNRKDKVEVHGRRRKTQASGDEVDSQTGSSTEREEKDVGATGGSVKTQTNQA